jgi:hypothetical protein
MLLKKERDSQTDPSSVAFRRIAVSSHSTRLCLKTFLVI